MNMDTYREFAEMTVQYPRSIEQAIPYLGLGLASEAGEVAGVIKKTLRQGRSFIMNDDFEARIIDECGDVVWYVERLLAELGIPWEVMLERNANKLLHRKDTDTIKNHD